jgi:CheY-like chemotaxis protein
MDIVGACEPGDGRPTDQTLDGSENGRIDQARILVIEDSDDHNELLLRQLRKSHLDSHVKLMADGQEAWDFLSHEPNCSDLIAIFLDLHLPSLDGVQLLRQIRKNPRLSGIPVIVITSSDNPDDYRQCRALKASAFINKPVSFATFSKAVADVFHSTETRRLSRPE